VSRPIEEFKRTLESVAAIANAQLTGDPATVVTGISLSSNNVQEGDLFVALPGEKTHGAQFAAEAIARGATAAIPPPLLVLHLQIIRRMSSRLRFKIQRESTGADT